jgi:hypothetical protein
MPETLLQEEQRFRFMHEAHVEEQIAHGRYANRCISLRIAVPVDASRVQQCPEAKRTDESGDNLCKTWKSDSIT